MLQSFSVPRPRQLSSVVKVEVNPELSRDSLTLAAGVVTLGTVLGKTAAGLVPLDTTKSDGSQLFAGIAHHDADATSAPVDNVLVTARMTVVSGSGLVWPAGISAGDQAAVLAEMAAAFVIVRA